MSREPNKNLMARVASTAAAVLAREGRLSYPLLLIELGVLTRKDFEAWRAGRVPFLEQVVHTNLTKLARIQTAVRRFARARGLQRQAGHAPRGRRYSKSGYPSVEAEYAATYRPIAQRAAAACADVRAAGGGDMRPSKTQHGGGRKRASTRDGWRLFNAEAAYADAIFRTALGDIEGSMAALHRSRAALPTYAPAVLSLGSVEYQRGQRAKGRGLFLSLLDLPDDTPELCEIIDEAGGLLIQIHEYADGLDLYRRAATRFPRVAALHQGIGCCAGHQGLHEEAVATSRIAVELEPENQSLVNDLGWSLYQAGQLDEAREVLERAVTMNPADELAAENLRAVNRGARPARQPLRGSAQP